MGSGKSSYGKKIAKQYAVKFFDVDEEIKTKTDYTPKELFHFFGEKTLQAIEYEVIKELIEYVPCIISTGDNTITNQKAWAILKTHTTTLWLNANFRLLSKRLKPTHNRPSLNDDVAKDSALLQQFIQDLYNKRAARYKEAEIIVQNDILTSKDAITRIVININNVQSA
jgi:shikimate kinase